MDVGLHVAPFGGDGGGGPPDGPPGGGDRKHGDDAKDEATLLTSDDEEDEEEGPKGLRKAPFGMYLRRPPSRCRHCGEMKYLGAGLCLSLKCQDWSKANRRHSATFGLYEMPNQTQGAKKKKNKGKKRAERGT